MSRAIFRAPGAITADDVRSMRIYWHSAEADEREELIRVRDLRFCRAGEVLTHATIGDFHRHLAALLVGKLDDDLAPCTRRQSGDPSSVRSVHRSAVDWSTMEPREWTSLERAGLPRAWRVRLEAGEPVDVPGDQSDDSHARAVEAARALLAHAPDGTPAERAEWAAERAREAIYGDALRAANGSRARAAEALGVAPARVTEAVTRYPALARAWPAGPRGPRPSEE